MHRWPATMHAALLALLTGENAALHLQKGKTTRLRFPLQ